MDTDVLDMYADRERERERSAAGPSVAAGTLLLKLLLLLLLVASVCVCVWGQIGLLCVNDINAHTGLLLYNSLSLLLCETCALIQHKQQQQSKINLDLI